MRSTVEGAPNPTLLDDSEDDSLQILNHFPCRDMQDFESMIPQIPVAPFIALRPITPVVRIAIYLECQARLEAGKVD